MSITSTRGTKICISKKSATIASVVPTAITTAKPAEVTVSATTGMADGDVVYMSGTGFPEIDGKFFTVGALTATKFELVGSNTTGSTGTLAASPSAKYYKPADLVCLCLSNIDVSAGAANNISVATFCEPDASVPGNPTPGTVTLSGYVDTAEPTGYEELLLAESDGAPRVIKISLPNQGDFIGEIIIGSVNYSVPLEGAAAWSFTATMSKRIQHRF
jgi:hypothetical protein